MDNTKLNALAGRAMGWVLNIEMFHDGLEYARWVNANDNSSTLYYDHISQSIWRDPQFQPLACRQWNPSTCADDALMLLTKACASGNWTLEARRSTHYEGKTRYSCESYGTWGYADTTPLAMALCALRAAGISETEIQEALK